MGCLDGSHVLLYVQDHTALREYDMALTRVRLDRFTAFHHLDLELSQGLNVLVGANGTGKTHLMKVCYAACDVSKKDTSFGEKLVRVFLPSRRALGRLVRRQRGGGQASVAVARDQYRLGASFFHPHSSRPLRQNNRGEALEGLTD